jgi:glycosyltransferase involved in cell wall biosynthesis
MEDQMDWPAVNLCVPTFRRPEGLRRLLDGVAQLKYGGTLSVVVVDNDANSMDGCAVVESVAPEFPFPLTCIVEPRRGQTYAYNTAFAKACASPPAEYVVVLDDDERPDDQWLAELVKMTIETGADIVGGPVFPVFDDPAHWLAKTSLYDPRRYPSGRVDMIYGAGSMLIRRTVLAAYLDEPFSHAFAFTGGSDFDFFTRCRRDGRSFAWADDAWVWETTPASRLTVSWLLRRGFRKGTDRTRIDRRFGGTLREAARRWVKGVGLVAWGLGSLLLVGWRNRGARVGSLILAAQGLGRLAAEFNILYEEYR